MKKPLLFAAFLCGCLLALPAQAAKEPGFCFGGSANEWILTPRVDTGIFWESNAHDTSDDEDSGAGWRVQPALNLTHQGRRTKFSAGAFYTMERGFDSDDAQDRDSYGVNFSFLRELRQNLNFTLSGSYVRSEDDDFYWADDITRTPQIDTDKREHYNFNTALGYQGSRWQWTVGAGWSRTRDLDDGENDTTDTFTFNALAGRAIGEHRYWNLSLTASIDDPEYSGTSYSYYLMTGISAQASARLSYNVLVGVGMYDYSGEESDTDFAPAYNASLSYKINRTFALALSLSSQYEPEYNGSTDKTYVWSHNLTAAVNAQWTSRLSSRLNVAFLYEEHIYSGHGYGRDYDRTYMKVSFNHYWKFNNYTSIYGGISWSGDQYSGARDDKDNLRADVGLSFTF